MRKMNKCGLADLVDDLVNFLEVTEITLDDSGIGLTIADSLREKGVKVKTKRELKSLPGIKIHCEEVRKDGFDDIPMSEVRKMVGWIECNPKKWDVVMCNGSGFECGNQETAQIISGNEEIKALLMKQKGATK